jgi:addiction module RelE/StbE family toxin
VRWTQPALRDLEDIGDFIARDSAVAAAKMVATVLDAAEALAAHPHLGRAGRIAGTRELVVAQTPFVVPYRVAGDDIQILAVFHGARRWPERFT